MNFIVTVSNHGNDQYDYDSFRVIAKSIEDAWQIAKDVTYQLKGDGWGLTNVEDDVFGFAEDVYPEQFQDNVFVA